MTAVSHNPAIFIAYAPRGGLRRALAYLASGDDVYGWFADWRQGKLQRVYFVLENYYSAAPTRYFAVPEDELHSPWMADEARCHELAQLQDAFLHEWLDLPGIRADRASHFSTGQPTWTYASPNFDARVLQLLRAASAKEVCT